ncbi:MAG: GTPase HflX [candidate division Zixibacteria bacterium]|nr:GTPase HflX [candidate division Zixibacteria bacterium]
MTKSTNKKIPERAILVALASSSKERPAVEDSLDELTRLAETAGATTVARRIQTRPRPEASTYIGKGLVQELKEQAVELNANCIIFDDALSPAQQRNLEAELETKVIDRSVLILDIFAHGARSAEARLQVELAQLEYTMPRLTGAWVHFSKQYGGIGSKGPGETQLEIDRRRVRDRISHVKMKLGQVDKQRATQRKRRQGLFKIALVGYTNAGKSTLFNVLTKSEVEIADKLFTTLDSTTRVMSADYPCQIVFSDTVGFIKKLPHQLVESFKSTLEEVALADLLLHVVDSTDPNYESAIAQTKSVLVEIGAENVPYILVYNKVDALPGFETPIGTGSPSLSISALKKTGIAALKAEIVAQAERIPSYKK